MNPQEYKNKLLKQLETKEILMPEFLQECAYWSLNVGFDELVPQDRPVKPKQYIEYEALSYDAKDRVSSGFWSQREIRNYVELDSSAIAQTKSNYWWLNRMLEYIPEGDTISRDKIEERMGLFDGKILL